eukprot:c20121_g1_i1 orf=748-1134(-)
MSCLAERHIKPAISPPPNCSIQDPPAPSFGEQIVLVPTTSLAIFKLKKKGRTAAADRSLRSKSSIDRNKMRCHCPQIRSPLFYPSLQLLRLLHLDLHLLQQRLPLTHPQPNQHQRRLSHHPCHPLSLQ